MNIKLFNSLTEDERDFIISHKNVSTIKEAQNDLECGNYNENFEINISCKQIIKKNSQSPQSSTIAVPLIIP